MSWNPGHQAQVSCFNPLVAETKLCKRLCLSVSPPISPSVGPSIGESVMLESKNNQTSVLELFCVCLSVLGWRLGCGWELDAPAHPYDKMYCVPASPFLFFSFFLCSFSSFFRGKNRRKCLFIFHFTHHLIQYHTHLRLGVIELGIGHRSNRARDRSEN